MLFSIKAKVPLNTAVTDGTGGDHLGVKQCVLRQKAMKKPAVAVCPVHHGRYRQVPGTKVVKEYLIHTPIIINK
jgi:hypothetical protein